MNEPTEFNPNGGFQNLLDAFVCEANLQMKVLGILEGMDKGNAVLCSKLNNEMLLCKNEVSTLKQVLEIQKQELQKLKAYSTSIQELNSKLDYLENNLPQRFTYSSNVFVEESDTSLSYDDGDYPNDEVSSFSPARNCIPPVRLFADSFNQSPLQNGTYSPPTSYHREPRVQEYRYCPPKSVSRTTEIRSRTNEIRCCPTIAYLTQEEFNSIPSYMKGRIRLTYDAVNTFIDVFNTALIKKYKIALQLGSSLKLQEKQLHSKYKKQENKATKGLYFITEEDLKSSGQLKAINTVNSLMSILRSCHRMHEVRGEGIVRFVVGGN